MGKRLSDEGLAGGNFGNMSIRYGRGMVITATNVSLGSLSDDDVVEVRDYDPVRNVAMAIGLQQPSSETPMHWMIYRAFPETGAVIHVHGSSKGVETEKDLPPGTLELGMEAIGALKGHNPITLKNHGPVAIGYTLEDALHRLVLDENVGKEMKMERDKKRVGGKR